MFDLPEWFKHFRPHQLVAISEIMSAFHSGYKVVLLDAPTGSGKTLIAEAVRQLLKQKYRSETGLDHKCIYVCVTKTLQDQFLNDYLYARVLKGRSNYPTEIDDFDVGLTADDCAGPKCEFCPNGCLYRIAKDDAKRAEVAVLNLAYALREFQNKRSVFRDAHFKILDECDVIENVLLGDAELTISQTAARRLRIKPPGKKTVSSAWLEWAQKTEIVIEDAAFSLPEVPPDAADLRSVKQRRWNRYVLRLYNKITELKDDLAESEETEEQSWIYTGYDKNTITFKPITAGKHGRATLWKHPGKWLLMSGSIISSAVLANDIGLEPGEYTTVKVGYAFDPKQRPVILDPVGRMKRSDIDRTLPRMGEKIFHICNRHSEDRILIHTHAYHITDKIVSLLEDHRKNSRGTPARGIFTYQNSRERELELLRFKETPGSILIAPSMDRGVDLPYDMCRVQIIVKAPFPYLGDKVVAARTYGTKGGRLWYDVQTIRAIVQMTGRGMRHEDDEVVTYVLDTDAKTLVRTRRNLFPQWWMDAVRMN